MRPVLRSVLRTFSPHSSGLSPYRETLSETVYPVDTRILRLYSIQSTERIRWTMVSRSTRKQTRGQWARGEDRELASRLPLGQASTQPTQRCPVRAGMGRTGTPGGHSGGPQRWSSSTPSLVAMPGPDENRKTIVTSQGTPGGPHWPRQNIPRFNAGTCASVHQGFGNTSPA